MAPSILKTVLPWLSTIMDALPHDFVPEGFDGTVDCIRIFDNEADFALGFDVDTLI